MNKRELTFEKTKGKCFYCGCKLNFSNFHIDHIKPKSKVKDDKNNINNLAPSCPDCNMSKGNLSIEEYREKIENLIFNDNRCKILAKYYKIKPKNIIFYYEKIGGTKCQKRSK